MLFFPADKPLERMETPFIATTGQTTHDMERCPHCIRTKKREHNGRVIIFLQPYVE